MAADGTEVTVGLALRANPQAPFARLGIDGSAAASACQSAGYSLEPTSSIGPVGAGRPPSGSTVTAKAFGRTATGSLLIMLSCPAASGTTIPALCGLSATTHS